MSDQKKKGRFIMVTEWSEYHSWPDLNGLRELRAKFLKKKGYEFFIKAGGRVLVDEEAFFEWLESNRGK